MTSAVLTTIQLPALTRRPTTCLRSVAVVFLVLKRYSLSCVLLSLPYYIFGGRRIGWLSFRLFVGHIDRCCSNLSLGRRLPVHTCEQSVHTVI
ncbi:hypothetical protein OF83DRAFT_1119979 [Amylostereum chailletii]|nr:hypothetical protein OF83DRAFT_1119979 [Amylostereum chailletii]